MSAADSIIPLDQIDAFHAAWNEQREKLILEGSQGLREHDISMAHKGFRAGWIACSRAQSSSDSGASR